MEFATKNPTNPEFWDERFDKGFTPWNRGAIPLDLIDYVQQRQADEIPDRIPICLIPGCGHAYELAFLLQQGWHVTAIDFSPSAVATAKTMFPAHASAIIEADFFSYQAKAGLNCIYERAFLCALPPERRQHIVQRWADLLPQGGLVFGFFFIDEESVDRPKGPPYRMSTLHLEVLMRGAFERIEDHVVRDSLAVFEGKERWQVWRRI